MGLPNGSWHDPDDPFGAVQGDGNGFQPVTLYGGGEGQNGDGHVHSTLEDIAAAAVGSTPWVKL
jgi:hypothetical protein